MERVLTRVKKVVESHAAPHAEWIDREAQWPEENLRALLNEGLGGLVVPRKYGGLGFGLKSLIQVCESIGRACASTAICFGMHCVGAAAISAKATPDQVERYLKPICEGSHFTTLALSEPGTGAHFYFPQTEITSTGSGFRLNGSKSFITNGGHADSYVISTVAADPNRPVGEFSTVLLDGKTPGLTWGDPWDGLGLRGSSSRSLYIDGAEIPARDLLGDAGDQIWYVFQVIIPYFLCAMTGTYLGATSAALDEATDHMKRRSYGHSGELLSQIPILQHELGSIWAAVERTRCLAYFAGSEGDAHSANALVALCSAKAEVATAAVDVVNRAMTLMGGRAYRENGRVPRIMRDVRAAHVMSPTTDILRTWAGRALLGQPILAD